MKRKIIDIDMGLVTRDVWDLTTTGASLYIMSADDSLYADAGEFLIRIGSVWRMNDTIDQATVDTYSERLRATCGGDSPEQVYKWKRDMLASTFESLKTKGNIMLGCDYHHITVFGIADREEWLRVLGLVKERARIEAGIYATKREADKAAAEAKRLESLTRLLSNLDKGGEANRLTGDELHTLAKHHGIKVHPRTIHTLASVAGAWKDEQGRVMVAVRRAIGDRRVSTNGVLILFRQLEVIADDRILPHQLEVIANAAKES